MDPKAAPILEVFRSYQGEGLFVGQTQTFLRLGGCPLRCLYCDTAHSWAIPQPGESWLTPFGAMLQIAEVEHDNARPVAVTGGEPLMWPDFLLGLIDVSGDRPLHLETAGHDLAALEAVIDGFDHISLDLKLPEDMAPPPGGNALVTVPTSSSDWNTLRLGQLKLLCARAKSACVKLVVTPGTAPSLFTTILEDLARVAPELPLFVTPASLSGSNLPATQPLLDALDGVVTAALEAGLEPRVLSQMHRALGVR